jgi:hypothetical protein
MILYRRLSASARMGDNAFGRQKRERTRVDDSDLDYRDEDGNQVCHVKLDSTAG